MVIPVVNRFRAFRPKPEELVYYLKEKRRDPAFTIPDIKDINIYKYHPSELPGLFSSYHPSELPGLASIQSDDLVWYFFCTLENKYGKSDRASRTAIGGSWKKTGKDHQVEAKDGNKPIGIKKIFVFYKDRDFRKENRTNWIMHEYSEIQEDHNSNKQGQVVLCRIERKTDKKRMPSRIERKPDKKRKPSSSLDKGSPDKGQPSDSLAYDSGNNVAQDILEVESQQQRNLHLPSSSDYGVADSNLTEVKSDQLQPNQHTSYVTTNVFPEINESQLPPKKYLLKPLDSGKWDAIDGLQLPISSVFVDDSIVRNMLLGSEFEDDFLNLEWELPDNFLGEETGHSLPPDGSD